MIDIEAIANRHLTSDKMDNKTFYEGHIVIDLYNAIEEIKELRAALVTMQGAYELGVDTERASVAAWLRGQKETAMRVGVALVQSGASALRQFEVEVRESTFSEAADTIERGEHNKENK